MATPWLIVGLSILSLVSGRSLRDAAAQAPAAAAAGDAIVGIVDPTGVTSAMFPVVDGSDLKVSATGVTVLKPNGQTQAVLSLVEGNSTIQVQPTTSVQGFITISQPNAPITQVPLVPRPSAPAPGVPADLQADLSSMPRFWSWGGGSVSVDVSVSKGGGDSSGSVSVSAPYYSGTVTWGKK
ncbi:g11158 [Coccomyxa elongata]